MLLGHPQQWRSPACFSTIIRSKNKRTNTLKSTDLHFISDDECRNRRHTSANAQRKASEVQASFLGWTSFQLSLLITNWGECHSPPFDLARSRVVWKHQIHMQTLSWCPEETAKESSYKSRRCCARLAKSFWSWPGASLGSRRRAIERNVHRGFEWNQFMPTAGMTSAS